MAWLNTEMVYLQTVSHFSTNPAHLLNCLFQVVNPKLMETLRQQVQTDVEKPYREKVLQMDAELEKSRSDYKKLKYDFTFLKSEYEHESSEHKRIIDELTLRYEAEVSSSLQMDYFVGVRI